MLDGLRRLEYRGYDSAGVAVVAQGVLLTEKRAGKLANLEKSLAESPCPGMGTRRSRGIERYAIRCRPGSVRTSMIESECSSAARASVFAWSVPSSRVVVECESTSPPWLVNAARVAGSSRLFAAPTPTRNEK